MFITVLQIGRSKRDNLGTIFLISQQKHRDGSNKELQPTFLFRNKKNYL